MTKLEILVDDYLAKHEATLKAGHEYDRERKACGCGPQMEKALQAFMQAHNERTAAFVALRDARKGSRVMRPSGSSGVRSTRKARTKAR